MKDRDKVDPTLNAITFDEVSTLDRKVAEGEGLSYYETAHIYHAAFYRNSLIGQVGNMLETYQVEISIHGMQITGSCTCDESRKLCKHVVALLYAWVQDGRDFIDVSEKIRDIENMKHEELVQAVVNLVRRDPSTLSGLLEKRPADWDEIQPL